LELTSTRHCIHRITILLVWFVQRRSDVIRQPRYFASRTINSVNVVSVIGARGMKLPTGTRGMELPTGVRD
jgi:hypothetical protein